MQRRFRIVDVFTALPFRGNPVAVILDSEGLDAAAMQQIANWTNLSETTFFQPATDPLADYQLRIFTPHSELPFAGHPTLGSAHAAIESGLFVPRDGRLIQQCGAGLVPIAASDDGMVLDLPPAAIEPLIDADIDALEAALGAPVQRQRIPARVNVGPVWIVAQMLDAAAVTALTPDFASIASLETRLGATGVTVFGSYPPGSDTAIEVRSFAPSCGVAEDPVCGSGNGSVAAFQYARGVFDGGETRTYTAAQGRNLGREGHVRVTVDSAGNVRLGGNCVTCVSGTINA